MIVGRCSWERAAAARLTTSCPTVASLRTDVRISIAAAQRLLHGSLGLSAIGVCAVGRSLRKACACRSVASDTKTLPRQMRPHSTIPPPPFDNATRHAPAEFAAARGLTTLETLMSIPCLAKGMPSNPTGAFGQHFRCRWRPVLCEFASARRPVETRRQEHKPAERPFESLQEGHAHRDPHGLLAKAVDFNNTSALTLQISPSTPYTQKGQCSRRNPGETVPGAPRYRRPTNVPQRLTPRRAQLTYDNRTDVLGSSPRATMHWRTKARCERQPWARSDHLRR